ncbi:MAG: alpha/beta hydrolase [Bacteroidota bacterium]
MALKEVTYKGTGIVYSDRGEGPCMVLLHGYLESGEIWKDITPGLTGRYRVICVDLPGHGQSGTWGKIHTMDDLAGAVKAVLDTEKIPRTVLLGHSMGGYVTMAFAELYPDRLRGYCLFHSTCFADTREKKANREREISLILCRRKRQIVNVNIPKAFANDNVGRLKDKVLLARQIALHTPDRGIIAILNGMMQRPDRTHVLKDPSLPVLLIGGMKDNYIPVEVFEKLAGLAPHATVARLQESGHMGMMEEAELSARAILTFMDQILPADQTGDGLNP